MTDNDFDRTARAWLEDGPTTMSDRVLQTALDEAHLTRQRRAWWPARRGSGTNTTIRLAIGAAAVVVAAMIGINLLPGGSIVGWPAATPTPVPTPSLSPTSLPATGTLDPGTYHIDDRRITPARAFTVPAGWATTEAFVFKDRDGPGEVMFGTWIVSHIYADSCHWRGTLVDVGTTVDELASALMDQEGRDASAPTDVMLGGFPAKRIELSVPADLDIATCDNEFLRSWPDPGPDESGGLPSRVGQTDVVYIVDVDGNRLVIDAGHMPASSEENLAELEEVLASIRIEPLN